jgi:hypothetical protein
MRAQRSYDQDLAHRLRNRVVTLGKLNMGSARCGMRRFHRGDPLLGRAAAEIFAIVAHGSAPVADVR